MSARSARSVSRRDFLQATGGLVIGFALAPRLALGQDRPAPLPGSLNANRMLDAWLRVDPNGTVTIFTGIATTGDVFSTTVSPGTVELIRCRYRASPAGGNDSVSPQRALRASASRARMASSSRSAATARKLPSRTTATTPGRRRIAASSTDSSCAPGEGGRTTRPNTMFGKRTSCT